MQKDYNMGWRPTHAMQDHRDRKVASSHVKKWEFCQLLSKNRKAKKVLYTSKM